MDCDIRLDNCIFGFYKPEDEVVGTVVLRTSQVARVNKILLSAVGTGYIQWTEKHGDSKVVYKRTENYINSELKLATAGPNEPLHMPSGTHTFQFGFTLPKDIPQSAEITSDPGTFGYIRYSLKVTVDTDDQLSIDKPRLFEMPFYVCGCLDLNKFQFALKPVEYRNKLGSDNCCSVNNLTINVRLKRTAFNPGEDIFMDGEFVNNTSETVKGLQISLCEKVVFVAYDKLVGTIMLTNTLQNTLSSSTRGEVKAGCRDVFRNLPIEVPWTAVPQLVGCTVIELQYSLRVLVVQTNGRSRHILTIPIVVGVIPPEALNISVGLKGTVATTVTGIVHSTQTNNSGTLNRPVPPERLPLLTSAA